jgi:hypothetical protein
MRCSAVAGIIANTTALPAASHVQLLTAAMPLFLDFLPLSALGCPAAFRLTAITARCPAPETGMTWIVRHPLAKE